MALNDLISLLQLWPLFLVGGALLVVGFGATAIPYRFKLRRFQKFVEANGFYETGSRFEKSASGNLLGMSLRRVRCGKIHVHQFRAFLHLPPFDGKYCLRPEGLLSGMSRIGGLKEPPIDDEDFDHAFWIETDAPEQLREFLTEGRRKALIYACAEDGEVRDNLAVIERNFYHPFYGTRQFRRALVKLQTLAEVFSGEKEPSPEVLKSAGSVSARKTRKFVPWAAFWLLGVPFFLSALFGNTVSLKSTGEIISLTHGAGVLSSIGLVISILCLTGRQGSRILLQSFFALLSLLCLVGPLIALFLVENDSDIEGKMSIFVGSMVLGVSTWGVRHYLKSLERPRQKVVVEESPSL